MSDYISRETAIAYIREQSEEMSKAFEELGGESGIYADAYNDLAEDFHRIPAAGFRAARGCRIQASECWLRTAGLLAKCTSANGGNGGGTTLPTSKI